MNGIEKGLILAGVSAMLSHKRTGKSLESGQKRFFCGKYGSVRAVGCPIAAQEFAEVRFHPQRASHDPDTAREAAPPAGDVAQKAQQQVRQQPGPDLPLDGLLVGSDEVLQLERLLEFLEEQLDCPARAVQSGDGARAPGGVVRDERHLAFGAVDNHERRDHAQQAGIGFGGSDAGGAHQLVTEDLAPAGQRLNGLEEHPALGPQDEEYVPRVQIGEKRQIDVGAVGQQHVPRAEARAKRARPYGVVVRRVLHDGEGGKERADVQAHVALGGRLAAAVPRPVDARERELERGRVHGENAAFEPEDESGVFAVFGEARADRLQMAEHLPVQRLGHVRITRSVGVRKGVALRRRRAAHAQELGFVNRQRVADVVQTQRVRGVAIDQRKDVTGPGERAGVDAVLARQHGDHVARNQVAQLPEYGMLASCWPGRPALRGARRFAALRLFVFHAPVGYRQTASRSALFRLLVENPMGC